MADRRAEKIAVHGHAPSSREIVGFALGVFGFGVIAFAAGRATAPGHDCCDRLLVRDSELIVCEGRLAG